MSKTCKDCHRAFGHLDAYKRCQPCARNYRLRFPERHNTCLDCNTPTHGNPVAPSRCAPCDGAARTRSAQDERGIELDSAETVDDLKQFIRDHLL